MLEENNLNQDVETNLEDLPTNFFGDDDTLDVTPTEEETSDEVNEESSTPIEETNTNEDVKNEEEKSEEETPIEEHTPFLTIRYNKEDKPLSQEEAISYAQKGMNYDHLNDKFNTLNDQMTRLAKANGMSVDEYIKNLNDVQESFELNKEIESLSKQFPNSDKELLKEVAQNRLNERKTTLKQEIEAQEEISRSEIERQYDIFVKRYPNVDPSKLEQGIYNLMKEGYTLLESYESFMADKRAIEDKKRIEAEKIKEQNNLNKKKSLGNMTNMGDVDSDDFLSAFMSD